MFFEPRSKGLKAIQRRVGRSKAIANISASFETLEPRQCCTANDDVFTKTAADFAPSADPNKNLVTTLDVLANDTANSRNKAHLSIGVVTFIGPTGGGTISKPTQTVYMPNGGYIQLIQDGERITGIRYGLPTQAILSFKDYDEQEQDVRDDIGIWCRREQQDIGHYYDNVNIVINQIGGFVRDHTKSGSGWSAGGSSLKDILGLRSMGIGPGPGVVLSIGGRAIDFLLGSYAKNKFTTLDEAISGALEEANKARQAELDQFDIDQKRLLEDFKLSLSKVDKRVFGNISFVYSEVDGSPITNPPPPPRQLGGVMVNPAAASIKTSSSATVAVNMNIEDYSAKLAQLIAWRDSHSLTSHRYDQELKERTLDDMKGDALIAFASRVGFNVAWENGQWVGRDRHSAMEPYMWESGGEYGSGVTLIRLYTFDGFDIADELNKIKYKKR
ncbi:MAG: hypothetical protein WCJ31_18165 [Planctomycetia bacterium]